MSVFAAMWFKGSNTLPALSGTPEIFETLSYVFTKLLNQLNAKIHPFLKTFIAVTLAVFTNDAPVFDALRRIK